MSGDINDTHPARKIDRAELLEVLAELNQEVPALRSNVIAQEFPDVDPRPSEIIWTIWRRRKKSAVSTMAIPSSIGFRGRAISRERYRIAMSSTIQLTGMISILPQYRPILLRRLRQNESHTIDLAAFGARSAMSVNWA